MTYKICEPALFSLLKGLVAGEKVYSLRAPQSEKGPFIIYQRIDRDQMGKNHLHRSAGQPGTVQAFMQVDAYAQDLGAAQALGALIEYTLDGYSGTVYHGNNSPQDFVVIGGITLQNDTDLLDETDEPLLFRHSSVYLVTYNQ